MLTFEQLVERQNGIGGSDAYPIMINVFLETKKKIKFYKTPLQVYFDKINEIDPSLIRKTNEKQHWGNILEPVVFSEFARKKNLSIIELCSNSEKKSNEELFENKKNGIIAKPNFSIVNDTLTFMRANLDGIGIDENGNKFGLEIKTTSFNDSDEFFKFGEEGTNSIPLPHLVQCAHYAICCDLSYIDIAVLINTNDFRIYRYTRNENLEKIIIREECKFWNEYVLKKNPPNFINLEDINSLYLTIKEKTVTANDEVHRLLSDYKDIKDEISLKTKELESMKVKIYAYMKDCEKICDSSGETIAKINNIKRNDFDSSSFKEKNKEMYGKFLKESSYRTLRVL